MTEAEASDRLEQAIRDWVRATHQDNDGRDLITGWVLLSEHVSSEDPDAEVVALSTSDGMTIVRQLGILDYAQAMARHHVTHDS